jgi:hypothetical protein
MKRGVPLFILGLSAILLAGRLAARRLFILHSEKPRVREGSHSGLRQGWGTPCTLLMSTFISACVFWSKYVAFGSLNNLHSVKKFFLP